jgi:MFS transporter, DHA1 family, tetracycline resistance protein
MSPLGVIVTIVLVDLLGFSVVMPLLAPFANEYGFADWQIGLLFSAYPLCQLVAGPILGRLSDRYGRRPVLVASQAGTALSFLILGLSHDFPTMLLARMLDGASGGNILVAQAYVADVTPPEHRARGLGLIGMAFGVGFVLGPLLAGVVVSLPLPTEWRLRLPFLIGAGFSTLALILVIAKLPESRAGRREASRVLSWHGLVETVTHPLIGSLVSLGFLAVFAFAALEATFSLFLLRRFNWGPSDAAFAFAYLGLMSAVVQGGLIRRLVPKFGERKLILAGLGTLAVGLAALAGATNLAALLGATLIVAVGQGLTNPSISGLLSRSTPASEQGAVFGTLSSAQTLARMVSYSVANLAFARLGTSAPFLGGAAVAGLSLGLAWGIVRRQVAVEIPADVVGVGVKVSGQNGVNIVSPGDENADALDNRLGADA